MARPFVGTVILSLMGAMVAVVAVGVVRLVVLLLVLLVLVVVAVVPVVVGADAFVALALRLSQQGLRTQHVFRGVQQPPVAAAIHKPLLTHHQQLWLVVVALLLPVCFRAWAAGCPRRPCLLRARPGP